MPKRTYQPKKRRKSKVHGYRNRNKTILKQRRLKGRKKLSK